MNAIQFRQSALVALIFASVVFAVIAWTQRPEAAFLWLTGMLSVPAAWLILALSGAMPKPEQAGRRLSIHNALLGAAALIAAALGVVMAVTLEAVPEDWSTRFGMLSSALVLIVIGNSLPKKVEPGCSRTRGLRIQRLLGYTFVVTGLLAVPVWLFLSIDYARIAGLSLYALAVVFSIVAVWRMVRRRETD